MLKMQVPDGQPKAGMVHHKIHDKEWTALGMRPDEDAQPRFLWAPTTAATLNLAATAAQGARIWEKLDKAFAAKCLTAAEKAWAAAEKNPALFAGTAAIGGGPYNDDRVSDEFYWAAAELYVTTKKDVYKTFIMKSPHWKKVPTTFGDDQIPTAITWDMVEALGTISLAMVPNGLPANDVADCKTAIKTAADGYVALVDGQGYRVPFKAGKKGFPWGSNSFVLNNALVIGAGLRLHRRRQVPERRRRGDELPPRPQPARPVVRHRLRRASAQEPAPPLLGPPGQRQVPAGAGRRRLGRPELGPAGSLRPGRRACPAARRRSASSTTSKPGPRTRSRSTGTPRSPGWPRSSTRSPPRRSPRRSRAPVGWGTPHPSPLPGGPGRGDRRDRTGGIGPEGTASAPLPPQARAHLMGLLARIGGAE